MLSPPTEVRGFQHDRCDWFIVLISDPHKGTKSQIFFVTVTPKFWDYNDKKEVTYLAKNAFTAPAIFSKTGSVNSV